MKRRAKELESPIAGDDRPAGRQRPSPIGREQRVYAVDQPSLASRSGSFWFAGVFSTSGIAGALCPAVERILATKEVPIMAKYLLIESRDPFEANDVGYFYDLASGLAREGNEVTLFLVQNGVLAARTSQRSTALGALARAGVDVLADEFSLRERGISQERLVGGVKSAPLDAVVDQLAEGRKALWH
jgi:predicted peroxiredoxin